MHSSTRFCQAEVVPKWEIGGFMVCKFEAKKSKSTTEMPGYEESGLR
jgi:hypothetical protein